MPDIERDGYCTESCSELIDGDGSIIDDLDPRIHASCSPLDSTDLGTLRTDMSEIDAYSASIFRYLSNILDAMIDGSQIIPDIELEAARELMPIGTSIDEGRSGKRDMLIRALFIDLHGKCEAILILLRNREKERNTHIHLLWELMDDLIRIQKVALGEGEDSCVSISHISLFTFFREKLTRLSNISF